MRAFVFPGQGSQRVGMGRQLSENFSIAKLLFDEADSALGWPLSQLCFEGPEDELRLTENCQPAILATSIALLRVIESESGLSPDIVAGHSLGEYSALVTAGVLAFADAVQIVHLRGRFMQEAVPVREGGMIAIEGVDADKLEQFCEDAKGDGIACIAAVNGAGQIVVAGHMRVLKTITSQATAAGGTVTPLNVSAPFHCPLMEPAALRLSEALEQVALKAPTIPVIHNVTAAPSETWAEIKGLLVEQVVSCVKWGPSVERMSAMGVSEFFEVGPGGVLAATIKRINPDATISSIENESGVQSMVRATGGQRVATGVLPKHGTETPVPGDVDTSRVGDHAGRLSTEKGGLVITWTNGRRENVDEFRWRLNENGSRVRKWGSMCVISPNGQLEVLDPSHWWQRADGAFVSKDGRQIITPAGELNVFAAEEWDVGRDASLRRKDGSHIVWLDGLEWNFENPIAHGFQ